ncbi:MAG: lipoprotein [Reyranellaceae bacterium]
MMRRAAMLGFASLLAACGRKSDPLPPSGADTPRRTYPPPEPAPTRTGTRQ